MLLLVSQLNSSQLSKISLHSIPLCTEDLPMVTGDLGVPLAQEVEISLNGALPHSLKLFLC